MNLLELRCEDCGTHIASDEDRVATSYPIWDDDNDLMAEPTGEVHQHWHKRCHEDFEYWFQYGWDAVKRDAEDAA